MKNVIQSMIPLAPLTSLRMGGPARYFVQHDTLEALQHSLRWAESQHLPRWILGGGSNVVIADEGLPGLVLRWVADGVRVVHESSDVVDVCVEGGHDWDSWVAWTVSQDLAGLECLSGIPGTVGAAPIQNIGAYGQELQETFLSATLLDLSTLAAESWDRERFCFAYRTSALKTHTFQRYLVMNVTFRLQRHGQPCIRYAELQQALAQVSSPTLAEVRQTILQLRRKKSMILDPNDHNSCSVGSFFTNPVVTDALAMQVYQRFCVGMDTKMPQYPVEPGYVKLAAAWLIERAGFVKGQTWGSIGISAHHALALVNRGGATARQLLAVACLIQKQVLQQTGVLLKPEPLFLGFPSGDLYDLVETCG